MYCKICGAEIEPVEICPKCGCLSGYKVKSSNYGILTILGYILPIAGLLALLYSQFFGEALNRVKLSADLYYLAEWALVLLAGISAFISFFAGGFFKKTRFIYPIVLVLFAGVDFIRSCTDIRMLSSSGMKFILINALYLASLLAGIFFIKSKKKIVGIASLVLLFASVFIEISYNYYVFILNIGYFFGHILTIKLSFVFFIAGAFLEIINCKSKSHGDIQGTAQ